MVLNAFKSEKFAIPPTEGISLKILTPEQMLQKSPKALAQVKPGNTSENLLN